MVLNVDDPRLAALADRAEEQGKRVRRVATSTATSTSTSSGGDGPRRGGGRRPGGGRRRAAHGLRGRGRGGAARAGPPAGQCGRCRGGGPRARDPGGRDRRPAGEPPAAPPTGLEPSRAEGGLLVLDDTYNANPAGARAALEALRPQRLADGPEGGGDPGDGRARSATGRGEHGSSAGPWPPWPTTWSSSAGPTVVLSWPGPGPPVRVREPVVTRDRGRCACVVVDRRDEAVAWVRHQLGAGRRRPLRERPARPLPLEPTATLVRLPPTDSAARTIAVVFGGPSPEHDVSILTGLQVSPDPGRGGPGCLRPLLVEDGGLVPGPGRPGGGRLPRRGAPPGRAAPAADRVRGRLPGGRGPAGEGQDGRARGGRDLLPRGTGGGRIAPGRPRSGRHPLQPVRARPGPPSGWTSWPSPAWWPRPGCRFCRRVLLDPASTDLGFPGPYIVKPRYGGSSLGIETVEDLATAVARLGANPHLRQGAVIEPYRPDLFDLNIAVRLWPEPLLSAIEKPLRSSAGAEILNYRDKYVGGEGMASAPRELPARISPEPGRGPAVRPPSRWPGWPSSGGWPGSTSSPTARPGS